MNKKVLSILAISMMYWSYGQEKDTLSSKKIDEVVITGQYSAQSINKSIYKVEVINEAQIKGMAANSVADVLNLSLNMQVTPTGNSGNSTANILGLDGEYVKVLVDNIPMVSDMGLGTNVDLTKLNVNNVERIEIVMGSMGVEYGTGALAGVINIITKKSSAQKLSGRVSLQEETVGNNYDLRKKGNGRHIQNLNLNYNINENWFVGVSFNHNQFMGYEGLSKGYKFFDENGGQQSKRGNDWNPKDMYDANATIRYNKKNTSIFYKLSYLNEKFNYYNPKYTETPLNDGNGNRTFRAIDRDYETQRWMHQLNVQSQLGTVRYTGDFSYQTQDRKLQDYLYDIPTRTEMSRNEKRPYNQSDVFYSRGLFSNFLNSKVFDFQLGYELDHTTGFTDAIEGNDNSGSVKRKIFSYANFISAEWNVNDRFSVRPGARLTVSNQFENLINYSVSTRYKVAENANIRGVFGTANKLPNFDQLFTYFVNTNHDVQGNPELRPEKGFSAAVFWDQNFTVGDGWKLNYALNALYLDLKDRAELVMVKRPSTFKYLNINQYKSMLFSANLDIRKDNVSFGVKAAVNGIARELNEMDAVSPTNFQYNLQLGANAMYKLKSTGTALSAFYKYTGVERRYVLSTNNTYNLGKVDSYHMLDFNISQPFWNNKFELAVGVKNLLDVTRINDTTMPSGGHTAAEGNLNLFYGRSYFARLIYQF